MEFIILREVIIVLYSAQCLLKFVYISQYGSWIFSTSSAEIDMCTQAFTKALKHKYKWKSLDLSLVCPCQQEVVMRENVPCADHRFQELVGKTFSPLGPVGPNISDLLCSKQTEAFADLLTATDFSNMHAQHFTSFNKVFAGTSIYNHYADF